MPERHTKQSSRMTLGKLAAAGVGVALGLRALVRPRMNFRDKTVLITGGTRGLGLVLARGFLKEGARVVICGREESTLERARAELESLGGEVLAVPCDVTDPVQVEAMVSNVHERFGAVDVLVNNAGIIQTGPLESMTIEDFEDSINTHLWGPLYTTLAVLPEMKRRGEGRIVNISSIGGKVSVPHMVPYSASKFALVGLSRGLAVELAREGTRVSTITPGLMRTGSPRQALFKGDHEKEHAWFAVSDSLPLLTVSSQRAARRIVLALERGEPNVVIGFAAKVAALVAAVAPDLTTRALTMANALLPSGSDPEERKGYDSESPIAPSLLTVLTERAATRNNER